MVNPNSAAFKFSEKVGIIIGKAMRYIIAGGIIVFLGGKLSGSKPPQPTQPIPNPPTPSS